MFKIGTHTQSGHPLFALLCAVVLGLVLSACEGGSGSGQAVEAGGSTDVEPSTGEGGEAADVLEPDTDGPGFPTMDTEDGTEEPDEDTEEPEDVEGSDDPDSADGDDEPGVGEFGYPCTANSQCLSGFCVESDQGKVCTDYCIENCPEGWDCVEATNSTDVIFICVSRFARLCRPCGDAVECNEADTSGNACVDFDGNGSFCGVDCSDGGSCPEGYECSEVELDSGATVSQCLPAEGADCECRDEYIAQELQTDCIVENDFGVCEGVRLCGPDGLTECSADEPKEEACNEVDDNCDGIIDPVDSVGCTDYWDDNDADSWGVGEPVCACSPPSAKSVTQGGDCNDLNLDVKPGVPEVCNGFDDNCDGATDEPGAEGCVEYYLDLDDDTYGDEANVVCLCAKTPEAVLVAGDCNDEVPEISPDAIEACNGIDDDCDGETDELNSEGCMPYFFDQDEDEFGVDGSFQCLCDPAAPYTATDVGDCNDSEPDIKPFVAELCDGIDNDCDGDTDEGDPVALCGSLDKGLPACVDGSCVVESCEPGWFDIDFSASNGCECMANAVETSGPICQEAHSLGTISDNGTTVTKQGIVVSDTESDWYFFSGTDGPDPAQPGTPHQCDTYHVRVRFLWNPSDTYVFDVHRGSCAAADQICVKSDDFVWRTDFFENKIGECPCNPNNNNTAAGVQHCTDNSSGYWVRVYRDPAKPPTCDSYNLEFTNGVY